MSIRINHKKRKSYPQIFSVFTEEEWKSSQKNYPKHISRFFSGKKGENFVYIQDSSTEFLIGLGNGFKNFEIQQAANRFSFNNRKNIQSVPTLFCADFFDEKQTEEFVKGLYLGTYSYPFKKDHPVWKSAFELTLEKLSEEQMTSLRTHVSALCKGQLQAMEWLNKPANFKKTSEVSRFLKGIAQKYNLKYTSFNRKECEKIGLGAFAAVNQGSSMDAAFTILEYHPPVKNAKTIGLIGKSVLFDTGGISLKNPTNMHYMKSDMGGATAVFGTMIAAAEMQLPIHIVAIIPVTDNAISEKAYLPSDVVTAYNGKTIEVIDTDAEGRMTLADSLAYMTKNYKTDVVIDIATLTGSAVRMFGDTCGAMFSNNDDLKNMLINSADATNQRLWNLPLWEVWKEDIRSDVADFKNISLKPVGDCIIAAKFLEQFIGDHPNWAHLDIAAMAFGNVVYAKEKAATGYGVQLFIDFIQKFTEKN